MSDKLDVFVRLAVALGIGMSSCNSIAQTAPTSPGQIPAPNRHVVILPLGDSITRGIDDIGYRQYLFDMLKAESVDAHFVGSLKDGPDDFQERHHEGHNGWTISEIDDGIDEWLEKFDPELILLMIGSNDIEYPIFPDVKGMPKRISTLIDHIETLRPNATLLVSEVSTIDDDHFDEQAVHFNAKLRGIVESRAKTGNKIVFVPMHDVVSRDELIKLDHPDPEGNRKMAARWLEYINPVIQLK